MMTLKEIIHADIDPNKLDPRKLAQCQDLTTKLNIIRQAWGKPMLSTSGVRTWEDHVRIYKDLANKKQYPFIDGVFDLSKVPKSSKHLDIITDCAAVDIDDSDHELKNWLIKDPKGQVALEAANLFCENDNVGRVHFQNKAFASYKPGGSRWFKP